MDGRFLVCWSRLGWWWSAVHLYIISRPTWRRILIIGVSHFMILTASSVEYCTVMVHSQEYQVQREASWHAWRPTERRQTETGKRRSGRLLVRALILSLDPRPIRLLPSKASRVFAPAARCCAAGAGYPKLFSIVNRACASAAALCPVYTKLELSLSCFAIMKSGLWRGCVVSSGGSSSSPAVCGANANTSV
ncbi:hypothetical protein EDC01DRAFT_472865 [Geopyxis carbonaria]|nr:hypothetical protein EDC01DRAFT_472865 [Geopyxis carbonaria]